MARIGRWLGEVEYVRGANWHEDIGLAAEAVLREENGPCVVFEDVEGCPKGFSPVDEYVCGYPSKYDLGFSGSLIKMGVIKFLSRSVFDRSKNYQT